MRTGQLRHRVEIQKAEDSQGETYGDAQLTFSRLATVWACVEPLTGLEKVSADQVAAGITHKVTIRYWPGITSKMRLIFKERTFEIMSVVNLEERNKWLVLMCMEAV